MIRSDRRGFLIAATTLCAGLTSVPARHAAAKAAAPSGEADILHVLNRISLGPVPGDVGRLTQAGLDRYLDEQLHPERLRLPDRLQRRLDGLQWPRLTQAELVQRFRAATQAVREGGAQGQDARRDLLRTAALQTAQSRLFHALESPCQLQEVMVDFWFNHFNVFLSKGMTQVLVENYEREAIRPHALGRFRDLLGATARHPAMLLYLDNWLSAAPGYRSAVAMEPIGRISGLNENYARELMELHTLGADAGYTQKDVTELARIFTGWTVRPRARNGDSLFHFDARRHDDGEKLWLGRRVALKGQAEGEWALDVLAAHPATARRISWKLAQAFVADDPPADLVDLLAARFQETGGDIRAVMHALVHSAQFRSPQVYGAKFKTPYRYLLSAVRACGADVSNVAPLLAGLFQLGMPLYLCPTPDGYKNVESAWLNPDAMTRRLNFATALASGRLPFARPLDGNDNDAAEIDVKRLAQPDPRWAGTPVDAIALLETLGRSVSAETRRTVLQAQPGLQAALLLGSPDFMRH